MKESQLLENKTIAEIASLLIPIVDRQILIPTVTVAEMIPYQTPTRDPSAPEWLLGEILWRDHPTPIISYEVLNGQPLPNYAAGCRIAVLNNTGVSEDLLFFGIATQGIPRLSRVKAEEIHEQENEHLQPYDLMAVVHAGEHVVIPNVEALEKVVLDFIRT